MQLTSNSTGILSTSKVKATGLSAVDGILDGRKWSTSTLTYSFPALSSTYEYTGETSNHFQAYNDAQKAAMRSVLAEYSSVANLTFVEVAETTTSHATLRFAETDAAPTAYAYYPGATAQAGDIWFNSSNGWYDNPVAGNYGRFTFLHEVGHAVGLKHAHESDGFGPLPGSLNAMPSTVMSYLSYVGAPITGSYTNASTSYAQTLMASDMLAIQKIYGANYSTNAGDTVYKWLPSSGTTFVNGVAQEATAGNIIFKTVWDGGGNDTYDLSAYTTQVSINLNPGCWTTTSSSQLANLSGNGTILAPGNVANSYLYNNSTKSLIENAIGGAGDDMIIGNVVANTLSGRAGNDIIKGFAGDDRLNGGLGIDMLTGGDGKDKFIFNNLADVGDTITDFKRGKDGIEISRSGFNLSCESGALSSKYFNATSVATHTGPEFIYDKATKTLLFDADGSDASHAIIVAHLTGVSSLSAGDIWLV